MHLHTEDLSRFVGGQLLIQNRPQAYVFRGEIKSIRVEGTADTEQVVIELEWLARNQLTGHWLRERPPLGAWLLERAGIYTVSLALYGATDVGEGRIVLRSRYLAEAVTLFPKGHTSALARTAVRSE